MYRDLSSRHFIFTEDPYSIHSIRQFPAWLGLKYIKTRIYYLLPIKFSNLSYYYVSYLPGLAPWKHYFAIYLIVINNHKEEYNHAEEIWEEAGKESKEKGIVAAAIFFQILSYLYPFPAVLHNPRMIPTSFLSPLHPDHK